MHPGTRMGLADAGAHVRVICDGGCPTFMITHWTRYPHEGAEDAPRVRRAPPDVRHPVELYGLGDRGPASLPDCEPTST